MNLQKSDLGAALMACLLFGCPKKADPDATRDDESSSNETFPAERENEDVPGAPAPQGTGSTVMNPGAPEEPDSTQSDAENAGGQAPPEPTVTWQGVRQDGLDVDHTITSIDVDATGAVFIGGSVRGPFAGSDYESWRLLVAKYGADGVLAWTWDEDALTGRGYVSSVSGDDRGNVYFIGQTAMPLGGAALSGQTDAFAGKLDGAGHLVWVRYIGTAAFDEAAASLVDSAGNVVLAGYAGGALPDQQEQQAGAGGFITKLDAEGSHLWTRRQGGRIVQLAGDESAIYAGEEGPTLLKLDQDGNIVWTSNIDDQSEIGDHLDDPEGEYSGDLIDVSPAVDRNGATLYVAGAYGGVGYQSSIYGFVGRMQPMTGELSWSVGLDAGITGVAAAPDGSAVYVTTAFDCLAFDANGTELWSVPMLSSTVLSAGVAGDLFLAGSTLFTSLAGTPGSGIPGARDWIVARARRSDGGLL